MRNAKVLVSGAGIAGATLAYWLVRHGFEPTLVETAPALRTGGHMIDFWGLGFDIAERMELVPALRAAGYGIDEVRFVDGRGRAVGGFDAGALGIGDRYLSILRGDLVRLLDESLGGRVRTLFADSVAAIGQDEGGVDVAFDRRPAERFDLVIGADGLHSRIRELAFGPERRWAKPLGLHAAAFGIAGYPRRDPHAYVNYAEPGRQISRYALRGDRTGILCVFPTPAGWETAPVDAAAQKRTLRTIFGADGWECAELLDALDASDDFYCDAVGQIRMPVWSQGRVALVGDACCAPSLLAGQGAALAMAGAYVLAGELAEAGGDHARAFTRYHELLSPFMAKKQRAAERFVSGFAPETRLGLLLRNKLTRLMALPLVSRLVLGRVMRDTLALPAYRGS